ncbi:protein WVD2-like 7 isoform X2 [Elaeis guineensis]|uniref:Protein WVD2-like 7 isoform X2 n=1 Tax=Elaeis guineensis var. tenera TaxID=51953 RepID=A0A8N4F0A9_ELAGV|nr:protein WVD2-like 7 isoform X2 [Elaeis guineensis]
MAGEVEDCINFQADSLPTGSISFGRFETETLSWERRSSFSHNRYLEEVEKYSTPGSVTQKKAYFEAHFKKNPFPLQSSSGSQNETECQNNENGFENHMNYMEDVVDYGDDEAPAVPDEYEVIECEREEISQSEFPVGATTLDDERVIKPTTELVDYDETLQTESGNENIPSDKDHLQIPLEHKLENEATTVEEIPEKDIVEEGDISSMNPTVDKKNTPSQKKTQSTSVKMKGTVEEKTAKAKLKTQSPVTQISRKPSAEKNPIPSAKVFLKISGKVEGEHKLRTQSEKQSPSRVPRTSSNQKSEDSESLKTKVRQVNKSEKPLSGKKSVAIPHPISGKSEIDAQNSANRPARVINSVKEEAKQSRAFNFRSGERAEKRKEFYMKLEEKHHAREAEMNEIQARTQDARKPGCNHSRGGRHLGHWYPTPSDLTNTTNYRLFMYLKEEREAAIRQLRKSLNFKATPMPSFYHEVSRAADGKKTVAAPAKSLKLRSKHTNPGSKTSSQERSSAFVKVANQEGPSTVDCSTAFEGDTGPLVPPKQPNSADETQALQSTKNTEARKEEKTKPNLQKGDGSDNKGEKVSRVTRSGVGKVMKGIVGGSVAVHVAS